jgi:HK97 gp10 family phage protein
MGVSQTFELVGGKELARALELLGRKVARNVVAKAAKAALKPIAAKAAELAPVDTGAVRASIRVGPEKALKRGNVVFAAKMGTFTKSQSKRFPSRKGKASNDPFWALFQEFGWYTRSRRLGRRKRSGGKQVVEAGAKFVPGKRFMTRAYEQCRASSQATFRRILLEGIEAEASALRRS